MDWQPIATAPRDGTEFVVWVDYANRFARIANDDRPYVTTWDAYGDEEDRFDVKLWAPLPPPPKEFA